MTIEYQPRVLQSVLHFSGRDRLKNREGVLKIDGDNQWIGPIREVAYQAEVINEYNPETSLVVTEFSCDSLVSS